MKNLMYRKDFLKKLSIGAGSIFLLPQIVTGQKKIEKGPPVSPEIVKEFVSKGHSDYDKTKEMLENDPHLLNVFWDWGDGDFESALGGASHVGNKQITLYLIEKGSMMNIFTAAMLGKIDIVKAILTAFPEQKKALGPHKLNLMHHARKGGDEALPVLEYFESLGLK